MIGRWQLVADTPRIMRDALGYMLDVVAAHGDLVTLDFGFMQAFVVADPAAIEHVLVTNQRNYSKQTIQFETFSDVTGNGLLNSDGDFWLKQRRTAQPAFHRKRLAEWGGLMVDSAETLAHQWQTNSKYNHPIDMEQEMLQLSLPIICQALFGLDVRDRAAELVHAVTRALDYVMFRAQLPLPHAEKLPLPVVRDYETSMHKLNLLIGQMIGQRMRESEAHDDLLGMLVSAEIPPDHIRDEVMTLIVAGYETVASGLTWIWYLLSQHPDVLQTLRDELDQQLGDRPVTLADLPHLPYLHCVMNESFRIYPPSWLISRRAEAADRVGDVPIPEGSLVIISPYVVHHNQRLWDDPERFDPSRFAQGNPAEKYAYIPFGAGARLCIGNRFAEMETQLVLATLVRQFDVEYVGKGVPKIDAMVTVRPKNGMPMRVSRSKYA